MDRPPNIEHPFFAYGILRPGQLGFFQLKPFVAEVAASEIAGSLLVRDGLPIIDPNGSGQIRGALLRFSSTADAEKAYDQISALEPDKHYRWAESQASGSTANVLFGRSPGKGSAPCEQDEWNGWDDPLLTSALDVVEETLDSQKAFEWDLKPLFRLQMAYLLLWSAIERYVSLRYHLGDKVTEKIKHLALEPAFGLSLREHVTEKRELYRADQPEDKKVLDPDSPKRALDYYYQVRSNIVHRGKGVVRDHDLVLKAGTELLSIFRTVLQTAQKDAQADL